MTVARLLQEYRQNQPDVMIMLQDGSSTELEDMLKDGKLDLAITILSDQDCESDKSIHLFEERYVAFLNPHHPFANRESLSFSELSGEPFIVRSSCETFDETSQLMKRLNVRPRVVYKTDQDDRAVALIRAGVGIGLLPQSFNDGSVALVQIDELSKIRKIGVRSAVIDLSNDQQVFMKFAASHRWLG